MNTSLNIVTWSRRWAAKQRGGILASRPAAPGSILGVPKIFSEIISRKIHDVIEIYRQCALLRQWTVHELNS